MDLQLGRGDEGNQCDGFTDMELRLGDVFRRIVRRDDGIYRRVGFEVRRTLDDHVEAQILPGGSSGSILREPAL